MKQLVLILAVAFMCNGCGYLNAIPRHTEIKRPVTSNEIVGRWLLTTNSLKSLMVNGFSPTNGEQFAITIRATGSYNLHSIDLMPHRPKYVPERKDTEGKWALRYQPTNYFKNFLYLQGYTALNVALDSRKMILWSSWGDPDGGIDLVYEKVQDE